MDDVCVPIVFVEYKISLPSAKLDLPKFINDLGVKDMKSPKASLEGLGHAGCMFINGKSGLTRYYEYGRYDPAEKGLTRTHTVPDVTLDKHHLPVHSTLKAALRAVSAKAGHGGVISAVWIAAPGTFAAMQSYADKRLKENGLPSRVEYGIATNSCLHFMTGVLVAAKVTVPVMVDPRPVSYIDELRAVFPPLDYNPRKNTLLLNGKLL